MTASRRSRYGSALMAVSLALTGCSAAMSSTAATSPTAHEPDDGVEWPLKFKAHYFDAYCFSTYGCKVHYRGRLRVDHPDDELQPSSEAWETSTRTSSAPGWARFRTSRRPPR